MTWCLCCTGGQDLLAVHAVSLNIVGLSHQRYLTVIVWGDQSLYAVYELRFVLFCAWQHFICRADMFEFHHKYTVCAVGIRDLGIRLLES